MASAAQFPINLVIPIASVDELLQIEKLIRHNKSELLSKAHYVHPDTEKQARLLLNGVEVKKGTVEAMKNAYKTEVGINQKTNIAVQEWRQEILSGETGKYVTTLSRVVRMS